MDIFVGLACRPADIVLPFVCGLFFEGLQSWLGGLASLGFCGVGFFLSVFGSVLGNIYVNAFACHATGLDAVQRLEQKKHS